MQRILLFFALCLLSFAVSAQNSSTGILSKVDYPQPLAPSPEAASLGKYGDIPVSLFFGKPNVSVPIYNFKTGDIGVDISLNYNSGGVLVNDIASNEGLGWSLMAGGVITRTVRGFPDESWGGDLPSTFNPNLPPTTTVGNGTTADYQTALQAITYTRDYERDIYFFNFLNYSGKFIIARTGQVCFLPANPNLKVTPYDGQFYNSGFIITDDKGFKYYFAASEGTTVVSDCTANQNPYPAHNSAWYLSKIVSPNNFQVLFTYESHPYTVGTSYQEVRYRQETPINGCNDLTSLNRSCARIETFSGTRLTKIYSTDNNTEIDFGYSSANRLDLDYNGQHQGNYLQSITAIYNGSSGSPVRTLKTWNMAYGYFGGSPRLKLLSATEDTKPPYQFSYDESHNLPDRLSLAQDHWGYYNGHDENTSLIPPIPEIGVSSGGNRNPDFNYMKTGSLISMNYPTGGRTDFEFEPHTNLVTSSSTAYQNESAQLNVYANSGSSLTELAFTLPAGATDLYFSTFLHTTNYDESINGYIVDGNSNSILVSGTGDYGAPITGFTTNHPYKLRINRDNVADHGYITLSWNKPVTTTTTNNQIIYGGLRVKSVKSYDTPTHLAHEKFYNYNYLTDPTHSSGQIPADSVKQYWSVYNTINSVNTGPYADQCGYEILSSFSALTLGDGSDHSIGYAQVTETDDANGSNGRNIYNYYPETGDEAPIMPAAQNWARGLLRKKTQQKYSVVNNNYINTHVTKSYYQGVFNDNCRIGGSCSPNEIDIANWKISFTRPEAAVGGATYVAQFAVDKYFTISSSVQLQKTEEYNYSNDGSRTMLATSSFVYGNPAHTFPTITRTTDSRGKTMRTELIYVPDAAAVSGSAAIFSTMNSANIISPVVEQHVYNETDNILLQYRKVNYADWGNNIYQPSSIQTALNNVPLTTDIVYNLYDSHANPLQVSKPGSGPLSYIWGYGYENPVAEIKGASYQDIINILGQTALDQLNTNPPADGAINNQFNQLRSSLIHAQVTNSTYLPKIGVSSSTNAKGVIIYYEYDALQRLVNIRDKYGNIVKHTDYHYAN